MEKRALLAIGLSLLIFWLWFGVLFPIKPPPPESQPPAVPPVETTTAGEPGGTASTEATPPESAPESFEAPEVAESASIAAAAEERVSIGNGLFDIELTNRGGRVVSWVLRDYKDNQGRPLQLVPDYVDPEVLPLGIELDDTGLAREVNNALYRVERGPNPGGGGERIVFAWSDGRGLEATKTLTVLDGSWLVDVEVDVRDRGRRLPTRLVVGPGFGAQEPGKGHSSYYYAGQGVWNLDGRVSRLKAKKIVAEGGGVSGDVRWAGLEDQYFAALVLPREQPVDVRWRSVETSENPSPENGEPPPEATELSPQPVLSVDVGPSGASLFVGPKKHSLLVRVGHELPKVVWFSSNPFLAAITKFIFLSLMWIHDHVVANYGLAIILATVLLRTMLFPLNQYSMVNMKKTQIQMQRVQPKVKAIRNKYKKAKDEQSKAKMNQEMMDLYKREGINPMGGVTGCLPMLAQFPILIGFYNMLTVAVELRGAPFFGWIHDLAQKDPLWITPVLMGVTMFAQQRMAMSRITDPAQQQQQKIMLFMPFFFTWICLQMPAGLVLYWFVNNLLGIGQQWLVNRTTGRLEAASERA